VDGDRGVEGSSSNKGTDSEDNDKSNSNRDAGFGFGISFGFILGSGVVGFGMRFLNKRSTYMIFFFKTKNNTFSKQYWRPHDTPALRATRKVF